MVVFFFKQKTAYEMRISDWSSDVCSSDLTQARGVEAYESIRVRDGSDLDHRRSRNHPYPREPQQCCAPAPTSRTTDTTGSHLPHVGRIYLYEIGRASCRERVCP